MQKFIKKKIGKEIHTFVVEGNTLFDLVMNEQKLSFKDVDWCGKCGSDSLMLTAHLAKNKFKYTLIKCRSCGSYINFGIQQENPDITYLRTYDDANGKKVLDWKSKEERMNEES